MKLHYTKIFLFFFPLNILLTSYHVYNKNKIYITPHHTQTNRSLCECDTQSSIYDKDEDMKSVKQQFDDRTSERLREYDERMQDKRQKRKEERDKNIQEIIEKDRMDKSLAEKVEKGCLRCGCGLGGVAAIVGLFGGLAVNEMKKVAAAASTQAGIEEAIKGVGKIFYLQDGSTMQWTNMINAENYSNKMSLIAIVNSLYNKCEEDEALAGPLFCKASEAATESGGGPEFSGNISRMAADAAEDAGKAASDKLAEMTSVGTICSNPIVISAIVVVTIAVILLIIYLILRYRRKKKMNKKQQYTKLLNQ
ncbi:rifin [Plasmodium falciparum IGH-CR14]|uniref:Rifin n=1 Tax=Plasmodium falciparum IGH-CR14 TaxID=580059 RepID=A0A0L1IEM1_PLAFA|nr:rifin [Plasmodium falciparum IGH-CR14]